MVDLSMIIELQVSDSNGEELRTKAWTKLKLFDLQKHLISGAWRVPFYQLPIQADSEELANLPRLQAAMFLRIVNYHDADTQSQMTISAANYIDYRLPPYMDTHGTWR